jgi:hypothetical protein
MRLPQFFSRKAKWTLAEHIDGAIAAATSRGDCARFLNLFQAEAYERLAANYEDQTFARLLALKLTNLAAARYHLGNRHSVLFSHPVLLMADPANACQLGCPGCVHSTNQSFRAVFDWPRNTLPAGIYDANRRPAGYRELTDGNTGPRILWLSGNPQKKGKPPRPRAATVLRQMRREAIAALQSEQRPPRHPQHGFQTSDIRGACRQADSMVSAVT